MNEKSCKNVLYKTGNLLLLSNTEYATMNQISSYYEVSKETIKSLVFNNRCELIKDGLKELNCKETKSFLTLNGIQFVNHRGHFIAENQRFANSKNILFPRMAILRIAFLLSESEIAKLVRESLSKEDLNLYTKLHKTNQIRFKKYETEINNYLKFSFGEENIQYQVSCGKYSLDFVLFDKIHIEVDEHGHKGYSNEKEKLRERYISNNTKYYTIRYNPQKQKPYELLYTLITYYNTIKQ